MGHDVAILSFFGVEGGMLEWQGIPLYPRGPRHGYGADVMAMHAAHFKADIVITLIDAWVYDGAALARDVRWVPWAPVDHDPIPPRVTEALRHAYQPITYSQFGQAQAEAAGLDSWYIPHGIETGIFTPQDRTESRRAMGIPEDAFLVGVVARNHGLPNRKLLLQNVEAFAMLKARHPEARLYLHTEVGERDDTDADNLDALIRGLGIQDCVHFGNQYLLTCLGNSGFDDAWMARAYSAMDVLNTVSMGEGFGLPIVEAQACGTPVIHGDWCAGSELVGAGWKVKQEHALRYRTRQHSYQWMASPEVIHGALETAYTALHTEGVRAQLADAARSKALQYDADLVARDYWQPALERLSARLETPQRAILHTVRPEEVLA